jgi:hypothetical protein
MAADATLMERAVQNAVVKLTIFHGYWMPRPTFGWLKVEQRLPMANLKAGIPT